MERLKIRLTENRDDRRRAWFDQKLHSLPSPSHRGHNFRLADPTNLRYLIANDRPSQFSEACPQPIGNCLRIRLWNQFTTLLALPGIVSAPRFCTPDLSFPIFPHRCQTGPTDQPAAANRRHNQIEIGNFLEHFHRSGSLTRNHIPMVIRMDERRTGPLSDTRRSGFTSLEIRFASDHLSPILQNGITFHFGRVARHHNVCRDTLELGSQRQRLSMVTRAMGHHSAQSVCIRKACHGVTGTAKLEGSDTLKLLTLDKHLGVHTVVEFSTGHEGSAIDPSCNPLARASHIGSVTYLHGHDVIHPPTNTEGSPD